MQLRRFFRRHQLYFSKLRIDVFEAFAAQEMQRIDRLLTPVDSTYEERLLFIGQLLGCFDRREIDYDAFNPMLVAMLERRQPSKQVLARAHGRATSQSKTAVDC